jgi:hypothetical protein
VLEYNLLSRLARPCEFAAAVSGRSSALGSELINTSQYRPADVTLTWLAPFMLSVDFVFVSTSLMPSNSASRQSLVPLEPKLRATFYNFLTHCRPVGDTLRRVLEWSKARLRLIVKTRW